MKQIIAAALLVLSPTLHAADKPATATKPNICFLLADDLRPDCLGVLGHPIVKTPNIDKLVGDGFIFRNAYTLGSNASAVCFPSRQMILRGVSYFRPGFRTNTAIPTMAETFRSAGYLSMRAGKPKNGDEVFDENSDGGNADGNANHLVEFVKSNAGKQPLFLYMAGHEPHDPQYATEEFYAMYKPADMAVPVNFLPYHPFDNGAMMEPDEFRTLPVPRSKEDLQGKLARYYASTSYWDAEVGRVVEALKQAGQFDNTIFIVAGDNGLSLGEHGLLGKQNLYEFGGMHVPLIFAGPGIPKGETKAFAYLMDIYPTLCELTGTNTPEKLDAKSLAPVITGKSAKVRDYMFNSYKECQRSIRDERWKLIRYPLINKTQLFDLQADPHEMTDLADQPGHAGRIKELMAVLERHQQQFGDKTPLQVANPADPVWSPDKASGKPDKKAQKRSATPPARESTGSAPTKPNILYLLADDLGFADTSFQGCQDVPTPNLDSIAKNGVRFASGYVSAPVCSPSRAGLLTGRYQTRFGHEFNHPMADRAPIGLPVDQKTTANWFKDAGYATAHIGKWHLGNPKMAEFAATARGFDLDVLMPGQNKLPPLIVWRNGRNEKADDSYVDLAMGREAAAYINTHPTTPWYLYVAYLTPHVPLQTPPGSEDPFAAITDGKRRKNAAMISLLDESVGRILKALRDSGQEERTLIVFHSDNGAPFGSGSDNTPLRGYKSTLREGGIRMPFAMQWKGTLPAGRVVDVPIISLDILPTALAAANVTVPADAQLDGVNLLPYLTGKAAAPQRNLFWRYGEQYAVRQGDWKLVRTMEQVAKPPVYTTGLYNLATDLTETHDLSAEHPDKVKELQKLWNEWNYKNVKALWGGGTEDDTPQASGGKAKKK